TSVAPGLSSVPASKLPNITACPPADNALMMSPENLIPPSAIIDLPCFRASVAQSYTAVICGTPTPATTRVVQIEPGPIPTLTTSAPASYNALVPAAVATFPATNVTCGNFSLMCLTCSKTPLECP